MKHWIFLAASVAFAADRYVNGEREFDELVDLLSGRLRNRPERQLQPSADLGPA